MNGFEHAAVSARRLGVRLAVIGVALGLLLAAGGFTFLAVSFLMGGISRSASCTPYGAGVPIQAQGTAVFDADQMTNAAVIVATGRQMQVPDRGLWVALATAMQESTLRNLDYGDRDSLGLFQQRPSQGWGTPAQLQDPVYASTQFYDRLLQVPGWTEMPLWEAAQTVQRSAFPLAYARWEQEAADVLAATGEDAAVIAASQPTQCAPGVQGGTVVSPEALGAGCTVRDPTTDGCITPTTAYALEQVAAAFGGYRRGPVINSTGCHAARPANPTSDHPLGKGCDLFPGQGGRFAQGAELDNGWRVADWLRANSDALGVRYIIWQGRIWAPGDEDQGGWGRRYSGGGVYDPSDAVGGHYDHIHVSFVR